jgi:hypothetical protein
MRQAMDLRIPGDAPEEFLNLMELTQRELADNRRRVISSN